MVSRQSSHSMTSSRRCSICGLCFWWFRRDSFHVTPQASSTIRHTIEIFRVMLSNLMFSKSVWCSAKLFVMLHHLCVRCTILHYTKPFHATLHHLCVRCTIRHNAEPFHSTLHWYTLYHSTLRWAISRNATLCMYAVPIDITLSHVTQRYTVCAYAVLLDITLSHLTQRYTVCVLYCKWVLSYSQLS